jgi:hypothetical protein
VKEVILQPFVKKGRGFAVRQPGATTTGDDRLPLYVCGEAYAWEQGWVEGALMTAERVVAVIGGAGEHCGCPTWFAGGDRDIFRRYMYAELSVKEQAELNKLANVAQKTPVPTQSRRSRKAKSAE